MIVFTAFNALVLINYWILILSQFAFVSGEKPHCTGEALDPEKFSEGEDVGYMRDVCVDIIARNIYNKLKYRVSSLCEELANMRTSTCFCQCFKWKRSSSWNEEATNRIMIQAEALIEDLLGVISKDGSLNYDDGKFLFGIYKWHVIAALTIPYSTKHRVNDAERRLTNSGAAVEGSKILDQLKNLKLYLCGSCAGSENRDLQTVIKLFIRNFETEYGAKISTHRVEDNVVGEKTTSGIVRLTFEYKTGGTTRSSRVILKIPSPAPSYHTNLKNSNVYDREALFYEKILPTLYQLGRSEPFAPKLYAATQTRALALEDLSVEGYVTKIQSMSLDLDHCQICLNTLAKYHALSYKYLQNLNKHDPTMSLIRPSQSEFKTRTDKADFHALCKVVKPFLSVTLYQKLLQVEDEILPSLATINKNDRNSMTVIIHGDFHARNILFKYGSRWKVYQAKIIDWQLGREASPVIDLIDFLLDDVEVDVFLANEEYLLNSYLATLNLNLSSSAANRVYNRPELDRDMAFYKYHFFRELSTIGPDILKLPEPAHVRYFAEKLAKWVKYLERKGFL